MTQIERIQNLLCSKGITSDLKEGGTELMTFVSTGVVGSRLMVVERKGILRCSILIPVFCPEYRRAEMAFAIARANWGLTGGSFRLDADDGELRYEFCFPVLDSEPTEEQLAWMVFGCWSTATQYAMALMEVAVSAISSDVAIAKAEANGNEEARETKLA
jgi:hypothetical protein